MVDECRIAVVVFDIDKVSLKKLKETVKGCVLPQNFQLDFIAVKDAKSRVEAYNKAISQSSAKYKFYIDEHTTLLQKDFFKDFIRIFSDNPEIGIIGCIGTNEVPLNGIAPQSRIEKTYGSWFTGENKNLTQGVAFKEEFKEVQCVFDGVIATQYDLQWREDLFTGGSTCFDFASQCIEFSRKNYKVVVISKTSPLIWKDSNRYVVKEADRKAFLQEYSADIFPLVSVLIPTFERPQFFKIALESALNQTYLNLDIMITDNSNNDETEKLMQPYLKKDKRIKYYHHKDFDKGQNWQFCRSYNNPKAEYVNWLMDDDVFMPKKIELMVDCYRKNPDVALVFSNRLFIDGEGKVIKEHRVSDKNFKMPGERAGIQLFSRDNFIGEPTTVLIKKEYLRDNDLGWTKTESTFERIDFSTWLHILTQGDLFYFAEPLSCVRQHKGQASNQLETQINFVIEYAYEILYAWDNKYFLKTAKDFRTASMLVMKYAQQRLTWAYDSGYAGENLAVLEKSIRNIMDKLMIISLKEKTGGAVADVHTGV